MSTNAPDEPTAAEKITDWMREGDRLRKQEAEYPEYHLYVSRPSCPEVLVELDGLNLDEATRAQVGRCVARRDQPHFSGDEIHGQCKLAGGHEVGWSISGKRRHPGKFPANVPNDAKAAVAKVLGISSDILEAYWIDDHDMRRLLFESKLP